MCGNTKSGRGRIDCKIAEHTQSGYDTNQRNVFVGWKSVPTDSTKGWNQYRKKALFEGLCNTTSRPQFNLYPFADQFNNWKLRYSKIVVNWLAFLHQWQTIRRRIYISFPWQPVIAGILVMTAGSNPAYSNFLGWTFNTTAVGCDQVHWQMDSFPPMEPGQFTGCWSWRADSESMVYQVQLSRENGRRLSTYKDVISILNTLTERYMLVI